MEDQPADSGDLTPDAQAEAAPAARRRRRFSLRRRAEIVEPQEVSIVADSAEPEHAKAVPRGKATRGTKAEQTEVAEVQEPTAEAETPEAPEVPEQPADEQVLVAHRPAGRRYAIAAIAAGVLFVGAAGFAGAMVQPYLTDRANVQIKLDVARTAAEAITTLWTYTPDNMDSLPDRSAGFLGGDFEHEYRKYIDAIVAPNKQAQVTNTTQVMGAAVETLTPGEATAIVYTNSVATSPVTKNIPSLRYLSYRLTMKREDAKWLITRMSTVTSLDLTPQL